MLTVKLVTLLLVIFGSVGALPSDSFRNEIPWGDTADMITAQGYPVEIHQVSTPDGYILTMHRIPHGRGESTDSSRPVAFLMHGLTSASHVYVLLGPEYSIAYNLADAGFDVWMGNARGNAFSRAHETLDPDHTVERLMFFNFTWDEIGTIDLPTMIDYTLAVTGRPTLHYIGHSQGGTSFLVLNSVRPEYNTRFSSAHLLAGVGYMEYFPQPILRAMAQRTDYLFQLAELLGFVELSPMRPLTPTIPMTSQCLTDPNLENMCSILQQHPILDILEDGNDQRNHLISPFGIIGGTGGAALKQFAHYGQNIEALTFRRWNYGPSGNNAAYGTEDAPLYDLSRITTNTTMHYTVGDVLLDERDVLNMASVMPNCVARRVARDSFSHGDFVSAFDAKELVTDYFIQHMLDVEERLSPTTVIDGAVNSAFSLKYILATKVIIIFLGLLQWLI